MQNRRQNVFDIIDVAFFFSRKIVVQALQIPELYFIIENSQRLLQLENLLILENEIVSRHIQCNINTFGSDTLAIPANLVLFISSMQVYTLPCIYIFCNYLCLCFYFNYYFVLNNCMWLSVSRHRE